MDVVVGVGEFVSMDDVVHALTSSISSIERMKILSLVILLPSKSEVSFRRLALGLYSVFSVGLITTVLRCSGVSLLSHRRSGVF